MFEGSGSCIPPVEVDRTVCIVGPGEPEPLSEYRLLRADLVLAHEGAPAPPGARRFALRPEPAEPLPEGARVALFTTGAPRARASSRSWPPPTWPAAARWPTTSSAPSPRAATSGSPSSRRPPSTRSRCGPGSRRARGLRAQPRDGVDEALVKLPAPETIVVHKGHGLPYSKGLMAQALSATALSQERSFELARLIERRLGERGEAEIDVGALHALAEEVLLEEEGEPAAAATAAGAGSTGWTARWSC